MVEQFAEVLFFDFLPPFPCESESESRSVVSDSLWPYGLYSPWNSLGLNTRVGSLSLLQGIFPTQESNRGLLRCRWILYQLSYRGRPHLPKLCCCLVAKPCQTLCNPMVCSPPGSSVHGISQARILEWVTISFSRGSSRPRDWTCISCIGKQILYHWATWEAHRSAKLLLSYIKYHLCMMFLSSLFCSIARLSIPAQIPHHFLFRCFKISFAIQRACLITLFSSGVLTIPSPLLFSYQF